MPDIYIAIGTEDFLLERNRSFHEFPDSRNVTHKYYESEGGHDCAFWDSLTPKLIELMFEEAEVWL